MNNKLSDFIQYFHYLLAKLFKTPKIFYSKHRKRLKEVIVDHINYYNNDRNSCKLKGPNPIKFRHQSIQSP